MLEAVIARAREIELCRQRGLWHAIAKLSPEKAVSEMEGSADVIECELATRPIHFSFPYGNEGAERARDTVGI